MPPRNGQASALVRAAILAGMIAALVCASGCGSGKATSTGANAGPPKSCAATVLDTLSRVVRRIYHEGVASERTVVARHAIAASAQLRTAVEAGDPVAVRAAAQALVAEGRMTNLRVVRGSTVLADVGGPALAPFSGTITGAGGAPIATYTTSVWSDEGFLAESQGVAEGRVALRAGGRSVGGSQPLPAGELPPQGTIALRRVAHQYASFGGKAYPSGKLRVYLIRPVSSTRALCGSNGEDTTFNTLARVARRIYEGEAGHRTLAQVRRVQGDAALLAAVAQRDAPGAKRAVEALLNQHIVRLRVFADSQLLSDVGGPYVLAPVSAPLRLHGRRIGSFVLSIQDDEGYLRLTRRLVGLRVLMYMDSQLVKNSLGPQPGSVPDSGRYTYRGSSYRVFTLHASAFPSGPLTIKVLIPVPYV